jgi:hypothetical protein
MQTLASHPEEITIRRLGAGGSDRTALRRLAERDSATVPTGPLLGAWHGDRLLAALALRGGELLADPFLASAGAATMLRLRARQLGGGGRARLGERLRRRRGRARAALPASPPGAGGRLLHL